MYIRIRSHKKICVWIIILFIFFIVIMPFILNKIYNLTAPWEFFNVRFSRDTVLNYYGAVLTFIGTVSLGAVTVYQNYISQKKTDEVNKLTLELQKKSMAMAEQNYEKDKLKEIERNTPKFELRNTSYNGHYLNLCAKLKNVSEVIVSGIKSISFEVLSESNEIVITSNKVYCFFSSLSSGQETEIQFRNAELISQIGTSPYVKQMVISLKKITLVWKFKCEDSNSNIHYYKAKLYIEDSNMSCESFWRIEKVG